jgi:DNA-binding NarL/FixJ family response regulator
MSKAASRLYHQATYGPLAAKDLHAVLRRELMEQFGFEHMGLIADVLIKRFLEILDAFSPDRVRLLPGQLLYLAVRKDQPAGFAKPMVATRLVPVRLTLVAPEDIDAIANQRKIPSERRPEIAARLLREADQQGGTLSFADLGILLGVLAQVAGKAVHQYEQQHGVILPHRGVVHDMGGTTTHKRQAIELKLRGLLTREIARRIHHDPKSVDLYLGDFERVYELYTEGKSIHQIAFLIKRSERLVREYVQLINEYLDLDNTTTRPSPSTNPTNNPKPPENTHGSTP